MAVEFIWMILGFVRKLQPHQHSNIEDRLMKSMFIRKKRVNEMKREEFSCKK